MQFTTRADFVTTFVDGATGRKPAHTAGRNSRWMNAHSGEIIAGTDVTIVAGRFAAFASDLSYAADADTNVIDARGRCQWPRSAPGCDSSVRGPLQ